MVSDVEVGSFLSGGIDSSYIVSIAKPNRTYTLGYNNHQYSEIDLARDLSKHLNINNYDYILDKKEYFQEIDKILYHMDEPLSDPSAISLYFLSKRASQDVKVVLSGEGADEIFGGYNTYKSDLDTGIYGKIPFVIRQMIASMVERVPDFRGKSFLMRNGKRVYSDYLGVNPIFTDYECLNLVNDIKIRKNEEIIKLLPAMKSAYTDIQKKQGIDLRMWFVKDILLKGDKMTMAHSLESRMPFTDKNVFEMASFLYDHQKVTKQNTKVTLREVALKTIPQEISSLKNEGFLYHCDHG